MSSPRKSRRPAQELPADIHSALVETLFGTTGAFVSGILGAVLVPVIAYARTRENIYLICLAVVGVLSFVRLGVYIAHRRATPENRARRARFWEVAYAIGAIGFMTGVGVTAALEFVRNADQTAILYGVILAMGCVGNLAGRNSGRPFVVYGQVFGICGPLAVAMFLRHDPWFWGAAMILLFVMTAVKSTTKVLNATIVTALLEGHEARLQRSRLGTALDSMSHGLCMADADQTIVVMNDRLKAFFGLEVRSGASLADLANSIGLAARMNRTGRLNFVARWRAHVGRGQACVFTQDIQERLYDFRCEPMPNGGFVVVVEDVTEARLASREIERMAHFDSLTGLPNRNNFHSALQKALARPHRKQDLVLLSIDLDQFKEVNDTRGHPAGDELLRQVADRLRQTVTGRDLVARFGGDEFQVLTAEPECAGRAEELAERLISVLSASYEVFGATVTIGASIGISRASQEGADADEMLRCADLALYEAKGAGRGVVRAYRRDMDLALRRKRHVEAVLRSTGLPPRRLEVEITESTMIEAKNAHAQLEGISALGVRIALDDFGTGYSSLSYLRQYPVNKIKIDRSFADQIDSVASQAVIGAVSVLAERLEVDVVFEGLERPEQLEFLKPWGVHMVQGYLFGAPMPFAQIRERLTADPALRVA